MGIFGGKKDENKNDVPRDIEEIRKMVDNTPDLRMSRATDFGEQQDEGWRKQLDEWTQPEEQAPAPQEEWKPQHDEEQMTDGPVYAPLFVKIDRYRNILSTIASIKTTVVVVKNSMSVLAELDRARQQTMSVVRDAMERIEKRLGNLDTELVRPSGFSANVPQETYSEVQGVESTLAELKGQIAQLKNELQQM
jgi:hypothetical protein